MGDICKDLRTIGSDETEPTAELMHEAATEIDRLRAVIKRFQENSEPSFYSEMSADMAAELEANLKEAESKISQLHDAKSKVIAKNREARTTIARLHRTFGHTHVAGPTGNVDTCAKCGLDLRDPIHT